MKRPRLYQNCLWFLAIVACAIIAFERQLLSSFGKIFFSFLLKVRCEFIDHKILLLKESIPEQKKHINSEKVCIA